MPNTKKFPKLIHVTFTDDNEGGYHVVQEDGVFGVDNSGEEIAVYQLVKRGRVKITKQFEEKKGR